MSPAPQAGDKVTRRKGKRPAKRRGRGYVAGTRSMPFRPVLRLGSGQVPRDDERRVIACEAAATWMRSAQGPNATLFSRPTYREEFPGRYGRPGVETAGSPTSFQVCQEKKNSFKPRLASESNLCYAVLVTVLVWARQPLRLRIICAVTGQGVRHVQCLRPLEQLSASGQSFCNGATAIVPGRGRKGLGY